MFTVRIVYRSITGQEDKNISVLTVGKHVLNECLKISREPLVLAVLVINSTGFAIATFIDGEG